MFSVPLNSTRQPKPHNGQRAVFPAQFPATLKLLNCCQLFCQLLFKIYRNGHRYRPILTVLANIVQSISLANYGCTFHAQGQYVNWDEAQVFTLNLFSQQPVNGLPTAQTCFFQLRLPPYMSQAILAERLRYSIHNCPSIDMDNYMLSRNTDPADGSDTEY